MIAWLFRWVKRLLIAVLILVAALMAPVIYVEAACRGEAVASDYAALLPPEHHRPEARTLLTYPEWHIVHAYDDYAEVIETDDPHTFGYVRAVAGFWTSLCALAAQAPSHGGFDGETKQMVYVIGTSFTVEMLMKALYEETLGRAAALLRGDGQSPLDQVSARQARDYATFLQQVPWYKWDFQADKAELLAEDTGVPRDVERRWALGTEYGVKSAYAGVIAKAVANVGADELTLRMVVTGASDAVLSGWDGVRVVERTEAGVVIETPRYRALTHLIEEMAAKGVRFVEIAGNDDILLTATSQAATVPGAIHSFERQGYGDYRHLILIKVRDLAQRVTSMASAGLKLEHIHDY